MGDFVLNDTKHKAEHKALYICRILRNIDEYDIMKRQLSKRYRMEEWEILWHRIKDAKPKGIAVLCATLVICAVLLFEVGNDRYFTTYYQSDFRQVYLEDYSGESTALLEYVQPDDTTVLCYTKGALSLLPANYSFEFQYAAHDDSSTLKIYASDYVSRDNSGGTILFQQQIDPNQTYIRGSFELDQTVHSLFILVETRDTALQIGRITTSSENTVYTDTYFFMAVALALGFFAIYLLNAKKSRMQPSALGNTDVSAVKTQQGFVFVAAAAVFVASIPLFIGLLAGHDLPFHMARIEGIASGLKSGQFPVRIHGETLNNYGYPNSLFYPELLLYVPAFLKLLGVSTFTSYKFYIVMVNALTVVLAYFPFKKFTNSRSIGLVASIVYLLNPYRLICVYYRAAIGEFTAITFLPLVLYGLYAVIYGNKKDWMWLAIGATGVIQSHILTTEMTVLLAAIVCLLGVRRLFGKEKRILSLLYAALVILLLNAWLLGPMLLMMSQLGLVVFNRPMSLMEAPLAHSFTRLFAVGSLNDLGTHPVGWVSLFVLGFYILYRITHKNGEKQQALCRAGDIFAGLAVVFTIATTAYFPWGLVGRIPVLGAVMNMIQFPYRCLALAEICFAALAALALVLWFPSGKARLLAGTAVVCVSVVATLLLYEFAFVRNNVTIIQDKNYYTSNMGNSLSVGQAEYLIEGSNLDDIVAKEPVLESNDPTFAVENLERDGTTMRFSYALGAQNEQAMIVLPVSYIPNYIIKVDGLRVLPVKYEGGRVAFEAPAQQGSVSVVYREPRTFRLFELISVLTLAYCLYVAIVSRWGKRPPLHRRLKRQA